MASEVTEATPNVYLVMLGPRNFASRGVKGCSRNWLIEWLYGSLFFVSR